MGSAAKATDEAAEPAINAATRAGITMTRTIASLCLNF
jgi:hypothetical protein